MATVEVMHMRAALEHAIESRHSAPHSAAGGGPQQVILQGARQAEQNPYQQVAQVPQTAPGAAAPSVAAAAAAAALSGPGRGGPASGPASGGAAAAAPGAPACPAATRPDRLLPAEVWARGPAPPGSPAASRLAARLPNGTAASLRRLCGRCLYSTLTKYTRVHGMGAFTVVLTGDIPAMWTRDSAVQMATYLPRVAKRPALRNVLAGAIRAQAFFTLQDPWANAYNPEYKAAPDMPKGDRVLGRGGWVWTRNFELDSIAYFFNFLWNWYATKDVWAPEQLLSEALVHDAVVLSLKVLEIEQRHDRRSPYRYSELPRDGLGPPNNYTGMVWSAFRPSDDQQQYSYNIPDNVYVAGALLRIQELNRLIWCDPYIASTAPRLFSDITSGIAAYGAVKVQSVDGSGTEVVYAYEVDGLGNSLVDFDDPNVPSLLAMPLMGWDGYDKKVYAATRARILSKKNAFYFSGSKLSGLGSPHTYNNYVWPLAHAVEALTTDDESAQARLFGELLLMAEGNGLVHESVNVDDTRLFSRPEFGWANAMLVVAAEQLLGTDCDAAAEEWRAEEVAKREAADTAATPRNGGRDTPGYYELLEAMIPHAARRLLRWRRA